MSQNPYAPPQHDEAPVSYEDGVGDEMQASKEKRFANFFIDSIVSNIIVSAIAFMAGFMGFGDAMRDLSFVLSLLVSTLYYLLPEYLFGWTPGKLVTGTRVISSDGRPLTVWRVLGRTLSRFVPFEAFSFLSGPPGWHDTWSNTRVIVKRR